MKALFCDDYDGFNTFNILTQPKKVFNSSTENKYFVRWVFHTPDVDENENKRIIFQKFNKIPLLKLLFNVKELNIQLILKSKS